MARSDLERQAVSIEELIRESHELEKIAGKIQNGKEVGVPPKQINQFVDRYQHWFAECLSVLPDDLSDAFRSEYQGSWLSSKIKSFIQEPTSVNSLFSEEHACLSFCRGYR